MFDQFIRTIQAHPALSTHPKDVPPHRHQYRPPDHDLPRPCPSVCPTGGYFHIPPFCQSAVTNLFRPRIEPHPWHQLFIGWAPSQQRRVWMMQGFPAAIQFFDSIFLFNIPL